MGLEVSTLIDILQEHQSAAAAAASKELPALAGLLVSVVEGPSEKKQRAAEALGCACGILEALRRLLPDQDVLSGRAADLQTAVTAKESSATASRGKVRSFHQFVSTVEPIATACESMRRQYFLCSGQCVRAW